MTMMTTRQEKALDQALIAHEAWVRTGKVRASAKTIMVSLTAKPYKGVMPLEEKIEAVLMRMAVTHPRIADALRMSTGAGFQHVFKRQGKRIGRFLWLSATDEEKAEVLGLSVDAYRVHVRMARGIIYEGLTK